MLMNATLSGIASKIYEPCSFSITNFISELEGSTYEACQFRLNGHRIICRTAKITPKKMGQFVTFWRRNAKGLTQPFQEDDLFDYYVINVLQGDLQGQFVIPKAVGIAKGLVTTAEKDGKRGFRVYPPWDRPTHTQAKRTQAWQTPYFILIDNEPDLDVVARLYT